MLSDLQKHRHRYGNCRQPQVTLVTPDGENPLKAGRESSTLTDPDRRQSNHVAEQLVVYMAKTTRPRARASRAGRVGTGGAKPGGLMANTVQVIAKVTAIDLKHHKATLRFPDGTTKTVPVRKDVDLTQRQVGEEVVIRATEALAISVEKP
jgi:hypothetical protein